MYSSLKDTFESSGKIGVKVLSLSFRIKIELAGSVKVQSTGPVRLIINQLAILGIVIEDSPRLSYNPDTSFLVPSYQIDRTVYIYV